MWKERGNQLFKDKEFDIVIEYYTLAMLYTPFWNSELLSVLLSNRCAAFTNLKNNEKALADAQECTLVRPNWSKV